MTVPHLYQFSGLAQASLFEFVRQICERSLKTKSTPPWFHLEFQFNLFSFWCSVKIRVLKTMMIRQNPPISTALFTLPGHNQSLSLQKKERVCGTSDVTDKSGSVMNWFLSLTCELLELSKCWFALPLNAIVWFCRGSGCQPKHIPSSMRNFKVLDSLLVKCNNKNKLAPQKNKNTLLYFIFLLQVSFWQLQYQLLFYFNKQAGGCMKGIFAFCEDIPK